MDARRLGVGLNLPQAFLTDAAVDYLSDHDYNSLSEAWAEQAYAELARPVHGKQAPLRRVNTHPRRTPKAPPLDAPPAQAGPAFRLADFLEQHGRTARRLVCPPASFWHAAHDHLTHPDSLVNLANAAERRHRLQWAHHLRQQAADAGDLRALTEVAMTRERRGDRKGAEAAALQAADAGDVYALVELAIGREETGDRESAETLALKAAEADEDFALTHLIQTREEAGDRKGAENLALKAAQAGEPYALIELAITREKAGDQESAETLARQAADAGHIDVLLPERLRPWSLWPDGLDPDGTPTPPW
ncbi:hypothetical protein [Streptomyces sp. NPDC058964]|uniref:hypothetical protein n=1 Tax=Streptomyces sp. NPDC058964 TaxID=3346681 RepID=UPI0036B66442